MNKAVINLLKKNDIIRKENDFQVFELENVNPFRDNVTRIFSKIKNKKYIIKKCKQEEIKNLRIVNKLLVQNKIKNVKVLMPVDNIKDFFLFKDMGLPLNKKPLVDRKLLFKDIVYINNFFLQNGYLWLGLALRNIFYLNGKYTLIDFENLFKVDNLNISRRYLLFLKINLVQSFEMELVERYTNSLEKKYNFSNKIRRMDRVEMVGWKTLSFENKDKFLNFFDKITIEAEAPLKNKNSNPFKIGHIIDELVSAEISFLWTLLMYKKRIENIKKFKQLLFIADKIIKSQNRKGVKFHLTCLVIALGDIKKYEEIIKIIKEHNDVARYDDILKNVANAVCELVGISFKNLNIIARGSYGECVLTKESDLDFEIVSFKDNKIYPMILVEDLVCKMLTYLKIKAEGTKGRPTEKDITINSESRDFFEIFELRLVFGDKIAFRRYLKRYKDLIYKNRLWINKTKYEKKNRIFSLKSVFEDAKFLITRLALMNNNEDMSPKIFEKINMCPKNVKKELRVIMEDLIHARNGESKKRDYQSLSNALDQIKIRYKLPICNLTIKNNGKKL